MNHLIKAQSIEDKIEMTEQNFQCHNSEIYQRGLEASKCGHCIYRPNTPAPCELSKVAVLEPVPENNFLVFPNNAYYGSNRKIHTNKE